MMVRAREMAVPAAVAGLEATWAYGSLTAAGAIAGTEAWTSWLLLVFAVSWGLSAVLRQARVRRWAALALSWAVWVVATLVALRVFDAALLVCFGSALLWWLGQRLARMRPGSATVVREFQFGLMALATAFCVAYLLGREPADAVAVGVVYVALGLMGTAAAQGREGGFAIGREGSWWGMLLVSVAAILVLGVLVGVVITPDFVHLMVRGLAWLWKQVDGMFVAIANRFASEPVGTSPGDIASTTTTTGIGTDTFGFSFGLPAWLTGGARLAWTILVAGMGLLVVWRVASQVIGRLIGRPSDGRGDVERLKGAFRLDMAAWFRRIAVRILGRGRRRGGREPAERVAAGATSMRELYQRLLHWAAGSGLAREGAATPHEFERLLCAAMPDQAEQFRTITREYVKARYGGVAPTDEGLDAARHAWRTVRKG
jgi:hypothetical protein